MTTTKIQGVDARQRVRSRVLNEALELLKEKSPEITLKAIGQKFGDFWVIEIKNSAEFKEEITAE